MALTASRTTSGKAIEMAVRAVCVLAVLAVYPPAGVYGGKYDTKGAPHSILDGYRRIPDNLLLHDKVKMEASKFLLVIPKVLSVDKCYSAKKENSLQWYITAFNVTDVVPGGKGGYAYVTDGGVTSDRLCLHLKSQKGRNLDFDVNIWGVYVNKPYS